MQYYKKSDGTVYAFDEDQLDLVTSEMVKMTDQEVEVHINPQPTTDLSFTQATYFPALTKRQFNLYLYDNNKLDEVNVLLAANPRAKIEFDSTDRIERSSSTVSDMILALGWSEEQVNTMWQEALTY